jgi:hypothetical protein
MVFCKYSFPNPNDGDNYKFTPKELVELLDKVYDSGFQHGKEVATPLVVTTAATYENQDDNTRWKEV